MTRVALYGDGNVSARVAALLRTRAGIELAGPFGRGDRERALTGGADLVVVATTSFLQEVAPDLELAVTAGANVITTAEQAACPQATFPELFASLDALARQRGVTILGTGINPGFAFDALVLTASGVTRAVQRLRVERIVDLSGFGARVLRRIGVGHSPSAFAAGVADESITGHLGFPESMRVVADALGVRLDAIERHIEPILAAEPYETRELAVASGETAGFRQQYVGVVAGAPWFEAIFLGHVAPAAVGWQTRDRIELFGPDPVSLTVEPGMDAQRGVSAIVANSVQRVVAADPGWLTVGQLPPAHP